MNPVEPTFKVEMYRFVRQRLGIDLLVVDEELSELPVLLQDCGECTAQAIEIRDAAKEDLDRVKAEEAEKLRQTPIKGKDRSETMILAQLPLSEAYREAQVEMRRARLDASLWERLMKSLESKSFSIHTTAGLVNSGFIQTDYVMKRRRQEIRDVVPQVAK